jgi:hypothetical protein
VSEDRAPVPGAPVPARPGYRSTNIWSTRRGGSTTDGDGLAAIAGVLPPIGGTVLRVIDYPPSPSDPEERRQQASASLRALFPDASHDETAGDKPGMHTTATVDYAICLAGTMTAILDECEVELNAGDILIQRGTAHGWVNNSGEMARMAYVLIDPS